MWALLVLIGLLSLVVHVVMELLQALGLTRYTQWVTLLISLALAVWAQLGLLSHFGVSVSPAWLDWVLMGLVLTGGTWVVGLFMSWLESKAG
jgi:hypothetical protein